MPCQQCGRPALVQVGQPPVALCLQCNLLYQQAISIQQAQLERIIDNLSGQMESVTGMFGILPRFGPRPQPIQVDTMLHGGTFNNISIDRSSIGMLNTGTIGTVDSAITVINNAGDAEAAQAIKTLSEAIISDQHLNKDQKDEALGMLSVVATEAALPVEQRRKGAMKHVVNGLGALLNTSASLITLWQTFGPTLLGLF
jgi:hypothetical protein